MLFVILENISFGLGIVSSERVKENYDERSDLIHGMHYKTNDKYCFDTAYTNCTSIL